MRSSVAFISLLAAVPAFAQSPLWGQCGGQGWTGPTTCVSGACCQYSNEFYSQCIQGTCGGSNPQTTTRTTTRTTTASSTQPTSGSNGQCGSGSPDATVTGSSGSYKANKGSTTLYTGSSYLSAINAALAAIGSGQRVSVIASGAIGANTISISSGKIFEVCGTIDVGNRSGRGAIESTGTTGVSIPFLTMTGNPYFGLLFYGTTNLSLGQITMNLSGGMGIRFHRDEAANSNVKIGTLRVTGAGSHAIETWNINGLTIDQVIARDVGECALLLQKVTNAKVGLVDGNNVAAGTGYATLRFANENGKLNGGYNTNIYIDKVVSRGGGRGIFCVSQSGGAEIKTVDLASNGNNAILIENCYNVAIRGGTVNGGGEVRLAARTEFANNKDISITLKVDGTTVRESPCGTNIKWTLTGNGARNIC